MAWAQGGLAVVVGASGAIGTALMRRLEGDASVGRVVGLSRSAIPRLDLTAEKSIEEAAVCIAADGLPLRLVVDATGFLHGEGAMPEKTLRHLDADRLARAFAINAIGPALLMKHFLPLLPREGKAVFATLSAKVGSIGDNHLGGWYGYRASKAALNQFVRTASIELKRRCPDAVCVALHPGTVDSPLSAPFAKDGLAVRSPARAAEDLLQVIDGLGSAASGGFFDFRGIALPW
jgi:NAD(P)-dependent dehydrogenase (short-subunit alcohol dehydrogenase family)